MPALDLVPDQTAEQSRPRRGQYTKCPGYMQRANHAYGTWLPHDGKKTVEVQTKKKRNWALKRKTGSSCGSRWRPVPAQPRFPLPSFSASLPSFLPLLFFTESPPQTPPHVHYMCMHAPRAGPQQLYLVVHVGLLHLGRFSRRAGRKMILPQGLTFNLQFASNSRSASCTKPPCPTPAMTRLKF